MQVDELIDSLDAAGNDCICVETVTPPQVIFQKSVTAIISLSHVFITSSSYNDLQAVKT